ncbi:hypothetical protein SDC9_05338 [bioreactor metagenome]|uniref:Uncharacterized protein n=1 Tax=bioreactor metagenome TaxID=1076179 RepID=A0A644SYS7_9ZZZZ
MDGIKVNQTPGRDYKTALVQGGNGGLFRRHVAAAAAAYPEKFFVT